MNSWKTKWHNSCRARYTVIFGDKIKQFITQNEDQSKKHSQKRFKLISLEHEALKDPLNYQIICKKCSPTSICPRQKLKELLQEFHDLTFEDQMSKLEFYCPEFGLYTSDLEASDFGKVSEPSLTEVQEAQSASFLSCREILNY